MSLATKINNTDKYLVFTNISEFIGELENAVFYISDDKFTDPENTDNHIKISIEIKGNPKLVCYIKNKRNSTPNLQISPEQIIAALQ